MGWSMMLGRNFSLSSQLTRYNMQHMVHEARYLQADVAASEVQTVELY